ncbi:MAG: addiction module protein [Myxococcota bacterium]
MSPEAKKILDEALRLPPAVREELAHLLWDSIDEFGDSEVEQAWIQEALRRIAQADRDGITYGPDVLDEALREELDKRSKEIESGEVQGIPWEEVRRNLRKG